MKEKGRRTCCLLFSLFIIGIFSFPRENVWGARLFVKSDGSGTSCTQASPCPFTTALANADARDTIFFKQGTYTRVASAVLRIEKDMYLYGGWDGSPSGVPVVNPDLYPTILNGQNNRPVVHILGPIRVILKGFTIQNGNANATVVCEGEYPTTGCGGGIYIYEAEALVEGNKILNNLADGGKRKGGGVHLERASGTVVRDNLFQANQAGLGGGLDLYGSASPPPGIEGNRFIQNSAHSGGALGFTDQPNPTIQDNLFDNNSAQMFGAGIFGTGNATLTNNLFQNHLGHTIAVLENFQGTFNANRLINNAVTSGLYLINGKLSNPVVSNNIFARSGTSYALAAGGEVFAFQLNVVVEHNTFIGEGIGTSILASGYCILSFNNNIISGYPTGIEVGENPASVTARYTLFDNTVTTHGNNVAFIHSLVGDPGFKSPATDDFHIRFTSMARDAGTSAFITTTLDIDGDPRTIGSAPDIGADEFRPDFLYLPLIRK